ncbi:HAAS signaling domain-containing protein [Methanospirillum lacunae]|uniref:DUF1700 domain-containing protein n=1 Tax=Methanospirillum lacunae TaxID=668570 RepID=A0A2V2MWN0_9EURY|nr:DUF1700 domain-containing protein [Methanospirillum lacunae]PWR69816.1 hypothetical protein DK846_16705 [Methanospirillum lacunae]
MQKDEYLSQLRQAIRALPEDEQEEILADYDEHFRMGITEGRTEVEIASALGDPRSIGKEYAAVSLVNRAEESPSARGIGRAVLATVGLGLFNLFVVFLPFLILVLMIVLILIIGFSIACAGPFLAGYAVLILIGVLPMQLDTPPLAAVFFGIGLTSAGLLMIALDYWLTRICYRQTIRYLRWNIEVISGKETL